MKAQPTCCQLWLTVNCTWKASYRKLLIQLVLGEAHVKVLFLKAPLHSRHQLMLV